MSAFNREPAESRFAVDLAGAASLWGGSPLSAADLFCTRMDVPGREPILAPTHMLGRGVDELRIIAYDNAWGVEQEDLSRFIAPGEIAISIKHHSPCPVPAEAMKLQCTHIQVVVGVEEAGRPGVMTVNNPKYYEDGLFGDPSYPMIFIKPRFPDALSEGLMGAYVDNIRTWLVIANTFSQFPEHFDGGDPLGTRSVSQVAIFGDRLLDALLKKKGARSWFADEANLVYCAELAHLALNLGLCLPLNEQSLGAASYGKVSRALASQEFLKGHTNPHIGQIDLSMAPDGLRPLHVELGIATSEPHAQDPFGNGLAIEPFTVADIVEVFIREVLPRDQYGEMLAPLQAALLTQAAPRLLNVLGMSELPDTDPRRMAVVTLYEEIVAIVGREYADYDGFRSNLDPLLARARGLVGPRADGAGAFVPPHCFMTRATDHLTGVAGGGALGWQYLGHGLHRSILNTVCG